MNPLKAVHDFVCVRWIFKSVSYFLYHPILQTAFMGLGYLWHDLWRECLVENVF